MEFKRQFYLDELIRKQHNGFVKVVTGLRRCGKSYLLRTIFKKYLLSLTLSATLFALSEFLSAKLGPAVGFTSLSHPASIVSGFLQDKPVTGIILTTAVHLLFAGIAAAVCFVSLRRSRIRKPKG